jgi:hypothetical protein
MLRNDKLGIFRRKSCKIPTRSLWKRYLRHGLVPHHPPSSTPESSNTVSLESNLNENYEIQLTRYCSDITFSLYKIQWRHMHVVNQGRSSFNSRVVCESQQQLQSTSISLISYIRPGLGYFAYQQIQPKISRLLQVLGVASVASARRTEAAKTASAFPACFLSVLENCTKVKLLPVAVSFYSKRHQFFLRCRNRVMHVNSPSLDKLMQRRGWRAYAASWNCQRRAFALRYR